MSVSYVGVRDGVPVILKRCDDCGEEKVVTEDSRTSGFYVRWRPLASGGRSAGWGPFCKVCDRRHRREKYAALSVEERRAASADAWERLKNDPLRHSAAKERWSAWAKGLPPERREPFVENRRVARRAWEARKRREDPLYFTPKARRRRARLRRRAERERAAVLKVFLPPRARRGVDAGPYRAWLMAVGEAIGAENNGGAIAVEVGLPERRVSGILHGVDGSVSIDTVDRAIVNFVGIVEVDGRPIWSVADLYSVAEVEEQMRIENTATGAELQQAKEAA